MDCSLENITTLIFDFGGVLYEIDPERTYTGFLGRSHKPDSLSERSVFFNEDNFFANYEKGLISSSTFRQEAIGGLYLSPIDDNEFDGIWNATLVALFPGTVTHIRKFSRNFRLILLSNTNEIHYNYFEPECRELFSLFGKKYFSYRLGLRKPDPEIFRRVLEESAVSAGECLFIDDVKANTDSAAALGIDTYLFDSKKGMDELENILMKGK